MKIICKKEKKLMIELQNERFPTFSVSEWMQLKIYLLASLFVLAFTCILTIIDPNSFMRILGPINPIILIFLLIIGGFITLRFFLSRNWFEIYAKKQIKKQNYFYYLPILLAFMPILIDLTFRYPETTNVYFPQSLLFYPIIGFVAETMFHLIPTLFLILILSSIFKSLNHKQINWIIILVVSFIEPLYQTIWSPSYFPLGITIYMGFHLYLFNAIELYIFKRRGFFAMYSTRLIYYLTWHIIWGYFRILILF